MAAMMLQMIIIRRWYDDDGEHNDDDDCDAAADDDGHEDDGGMTIMFIMAILIIAFIDSIIIMIIVIRFFFVALIHVCLGSLEAWRHGCLETSGLGRLKTGDRWRKRGVKGGENGGERRMPPVPRRSSLFRALEGSILGRCWGSILGWLGGRFWVGLGVDLILTLLAGAYSRSFAFGGCYVRPQSTIGRQAL